MLDNPNVREIRGYPTVYINKRRFLLPPEYQVGDKVNAQELPKSDPTKKDKARHLLLGTDFIGEKRANFLASGFAKFIPVRYFSWFFAGIGIINFLCIFYIMNIQSTPTPRTLLYGISLYLLLAAILFWHEIGHCAAATRMGIRVDSIGGGLYLVFPALYSRISLVGLLSWPERIVLYSSGIFFQMLLSVGIFALYITTQAQILRHLFFMNIFMIGLNLIPVFHLDGYRILTEILGRYTDQRLRRKILIGCITLTLAIILFFIVRLVSSLYVLIPKILENPSIFNIASGIALTGFLILILVTVPRWLKKPYG